MEDISFSALLIFFGAPSSITADTSAPFSVSRSITSYINCFKMSQFKLLVKKYAVGTNHGFWSTHTMKRRSLVAIVSRASALKVPKTTFPKNSVLMHVGIMYNRQKSINSPKSLKPTSNKQYLQCLWTSCLFVCLFVYLFVNAGWVFWQLCSWCGPAAYG